LRRFWFNAVRRGDARLWQLIKDIAVAKNSLEALLRPDDSLLALIDHQPFHVSPPDLAAATLGYPYASEMS
jgi:hypothetical protein